ncbi:MAG: ATP-binding protein [Pseudomonadota bacterium]
MANKTPDVTLLERIAASLERLAPKAEKPLRLDGSDAFVWQPQTHALIPVEDTKALPLHLLLGIDQQKSILLANTERFQNKLPANNALLWGARGTGKSSIVKAIHASLKAPRPALVEIHREDLSSLPGLLSGLKAIDRQVILFCDDLSFDKNDTSYKSLKAVLDGGLTGRPDNVIFYATSNRRHLMPRDMMENERATAINPAEAVEEAVSLSDRFGIWLGFHNYNQQRYLEIVYAYADHFTLPTDGLEPAAKEWSVTRGARSGRIAWQFIQDWAGRHGKRLTL